MHVVCNINIKGCNYVLYHLAHYIDGQIDPSLTIVCARLYYMLCGQWTINWHIYDASW